MSDLGLLVSFVKTVIRPKAKAIGLLNTEIDNLGAKIVRAWLATVPDDGDGEMGEVIVKVVEGGGCEEVAIVEGLLCPHETTFDREFPDIEGIERCTTAGSGRANVRSTSLGGFTLALTSCT